MVRFRTCLQNRFCIPNDSFLSQALAKVSIDSPVRDVKDLSKSNKRYLHCQYFIQWIGPSSKPLSEPSSVRPILSPAEQAVISQGSNGATPRLKVRPRFCVLYAVLYKPQVLGFINLWLLILFQKPCRMEYLNSPILVRLRDDIAGFLSRGLGGAFAPLALACPLGNFVLTVNQFKCFEIFNNCYA